MESDLRKQILETIMAYSESWPDVVALWSGMVKQLVDDGWTDQAARALVLSSVTADNAAILCIFPDISEQEDDDDYGEDTITE